MHEVILGGSRALVKTHFSERECVCVGVRDDSKRCDKRSTNMYHLNSRVDSDIWISTVLREQEVKA